MIHKIKAMYDEGKGCSIHQISEKLALSRNTVRKYLRMNEDEITAIHNSQERSKLLDQHREYIIFLLEKYPKISAVKIKRKLEEKGFVIPLSERSVRYYVKPIKDEICTQHVRNYEPVIDMIPGVQCQVDPGEKKGVLINGKPTDIYFVVFILSYSRKMYVTFCDTPINTGIFIKMHNKAFSYFNGVVEECVYDQTKLVVIKEEFREVCFNEEFYRYATYASFSLRICEGYDPESKGKVESGVKYVKQSFLYGDEFESLADLEERSFEWLEKVANHRIHGTTKKQPSIVYEQEEASKMKPYLSPTYLSLENAEARNVDKTSLISYKSNKYSVPMAYQSSTVSIQIKGRQLIILDIVTSKEVARHAIYEGRGHIEKNSNHYRDYTKKIEEREEELAKVIGPEFSEKLCFLLKKTSPKIYKDQVAGAISLLKKYQKEYCLKDALTGLVDRSCLTATFLKEYLSSFSPKREESLTVKDDTKENPTGELRAYEGLSSSPERGGSDQ